MKKIVFLAILFMAGTSLNAQVYNPITYNFNGTPTHGVKIKTNLPYTNGTQMPTIILEGYNYGEASPIGLTLVYYIYGGNFISYKVSSHGGYTPTVKLASEGGKVVIFIDDKQYYNRFNVRVIAKGMSEQSSWFSGWTVVDEALSGSNQVTVPYENEFGGIKVNGTNSTASVNGFRNMIQLTNSGHSAIVYNSGQKSELMFGFHSNGNFYWGTGRSATKPNHYAMFLNANSGNLGIKGKLTANEVQVKPGGWADFVFEPNYNLSSLEDLEQYIKVNKHLPDVPGEKEIKEKGLSLGKSDAILLQKIEELTLYLIEQNKKIIKLESEVEELKYDKN